MTDGNQAREWLRMVQHDLVKRLLWPARDCQALQKKPEPRGLVPHLIDGEGNPIEAEALWVLLREQAPEGLHLENFELTLEASLAAARADDLEGVLALQSAFDALRSQAQ